MFSSLQEAFSWIESHANFEKHAPVPEEYKLTRIRKLLFHLGNPHEKVPCIHIAGSKGKSSTTMLLAQMLSMKFQKIGMFISPHIYSYCERITINNTVLPDNTYLHHINTLYTLLDTRQSDPNLQNTTTFELLTALGFLIFEKEHCEYAVIETGLGGRLDTTNVIHPTLSIITLIEKEHTHILGTTIVEIAREKAGIIKLNTPILCGAQSFSEVYGILQDTAEKQKSPIHYTHEYLQLDSSRIIKDHTKTVVLDLSTSPPSSIEILHKALGNAVSENICNAAAAMKILFPHISMTSCMHAIKEYVLPGRVELLHSEPPILLDGAHTPLSLSATIKVFTELFPSPNRIIIFSCLEDKPYIEMISIIAAHAQELIFTIATDFRPSPIEKMMQYCTHMHINARTILSPALALEEARKAQMPILVTGSLYLVSQIKSMY